MHAPSPPATNTPARWFLALVIVIFTAAASAPTPMYQLYQQSWHFSASMLTAVFAVYVLTLLISLLIFGSASDYIGRKPVIFTALVFEIVAMVFFLIAKDVQTLLIARAIQGFATGIATAVLGAALFDNDHHKGPITNAIAPLLGLASGAVITGILVEYGPSPLHLSYLAMLLVMVVLALLLWGLPETATRRPGILKSLTPRVFVPETARATMLEIAPANGSAWALGGFYLSLAPSVIARATDAPSSLAGGFAVACLMLSGAVSVLIAQKRQPAETLLAGTFIQTLGIIVLVLGIGLGMLWVFLAGSILAGFGFGATFLGSIRTLLPRAEPHERGGLMAAFYVMSYLSFCIPALLAGKLVSIWGLIRTAEGYGIALVALTFLALVLQIRKRQQRVAATGKV
ncbi:MFS transporter [Thalassospira alkalitolerans]|uniref:MFS transporter n=1 Tax=Thalassospira alkalitolerans TaxID=1293890 RepID=A0A1Y2LG91_9PROT|nr:MFS transporter [Thalassospira alkalitolerans]OSQ50359.1 MFS transporter [Thalassospira alkalitolerans]